MQLTIFKAAYVAAHGGDIDEFIRELRDQANMPGDGYLEAELDKSGLKALAQQLSVRPDKKVE